MGFIVYISDYIVPFIIFYVIGYALINKENVYDNFIDGAKEGLRVVGGLVPTLVGLMVAIGIVRASGLFEKISEIIEPVMNIIKFPAELAPLVLIKMFSSSAATSLLIDIYKEYGTDSYIGTLGSVLMSCSETIFYTLAVYTSTCKIKKMRYTLAGAIFATIIGVMVSSLLVAKMF